ncbi:MAG: hypothetical protein IKE41_01625, partial [Clostridia bacterium]|nr:hypothetical protein [Clostridia bacterium]
MKRLSQFNDAICTGIISGSGIRHDYAMVIASDSKYINLLLEVSVNYGIIVASPTETDLIAEEVDFINRECRPRLGHDKAPPKIFLLGILKKASAGCIYGSKIPQITRFLLISPTIKSNLSKIRHAIETFIGEKMTFIFGDDEQSIKQASLIKPYERENVEVLILPKLDRYLSNYDSGLMPLIKKHLLKQISMLPESERIKPFEWRTKQQIAKEKDEAIVRMYNRKKKQNDKFIWSPENVAKIIRLNDRLWVLMQEADRRGKAIYKDIQKLINEGKSYYSKDFYVEVAILYKGELAEGADKSTLKESIESCTCKNGFDLKLHDKECEQFNKIYK